MTCKVFVSPAAKAELAELLAYLRKRFGKVPANNLKVAFRIMLKNISNNPLQYIEMPDRPGMRKAVLESLTVVLYRVEGDTATIHRVRDGRTAYI
jgi:plasmid stabilization system protein ParE